MEAILDFWISQKLQESAKIERKVIKTTTKHCAGPLMIPKLEMILGNDTTNNLEWRALHGKPLDIYLIILIQLKKQGKDKFLRYKSN